MASITLAGKVCSSVPDSDGDALADPVSAAACRQRQASARLHQIHCAQAEKQRDGGEHFEIDNRFETDAAHRL